MQVRNKEWLQSMEPGELGAWFDAEHVDELQDVAHGSGRVTKTDEMLLDRLQRENMQLAHDLGECMAERDRYREKLGRAVDSAWEIVQLMDDDGCDAAGPELSSCEVYVLDDGTYQCGNCGAIIAGVVAEGESEDGDWA